MDHLRIYNIASFAHRWIPVGGLQRYEMTDMANIGFHTLRVPTKDRPALSIFCSSEIYVTESLIQDDTYELVLWVRYYVSSPAGLSPASLFRRLRHRLTDRPTFTTVSRFWLLRIRPSHPPEVVISRRFAFQHRDMFVYTSEAGHGFSWDRDSSDTGTARITRLVVHAPDDAGKSQRGDIIMPVGEAPSDVQMARTGAVMFRYDSNIVVCYYL
jgi:hypothetical protein